MVCVNTYILVLRLLLILKNSVILHPEASVDAQPALRLDSFADKQTSKCDIDSP